MLPAFFMLAFLISRVGSQVVLTVFPATVEPDVTPSITLSCSLAELAKGQILSVSIFRRAATAKQAKVSPKEVIAEVRGPSPGEVFVISSQANLTAQGYIALSEAEIDALEAQATPPPVALTPEEELLAEQKAELASLQADRGTYLDVTWPAPEIQDIGVYTCVVNVVGVAAGATAGATSGATAGATSGATAGSTGGATWIAEVQVASSNPATDRLLANIVRIEEQSNAFNRTLSDFRLEVDNITAVLDEVRRIQNEHILGNPSAAVNITETKPSAAVNITETKPSAAVNITETKPSAAVNITETKPSAAVNITETKPSAAVNITETKVPSGETPVTPVKEIPAQGPVSQPAGEDLAGLMSILESLEVAFVGFNQTLERLDGIIATLKQRVDEASTNTTSQGQVIVDEVRLSFAIGNDSYVLYNTNQNATAERAQTVCENGLSYLAEITGTEELQILSDAIAPYVDNGSLVVVGGQKAAGQDVWIFQNSQQNVTVLPQGPTGAGNSPNNQSLALNKSQDGWTVVPLSCTSDQGRLFFLCQQDSSAN